MNKIIQKLRSKVVDQYSYFAWKRLIGSIRFSQSSGGIKRLLILPCDVGTVIGSKGDEAMLHAVLGEIKSGNPGVCVGVVTNDAGAKVAGDLGFEAIPVWRSPWNLETALNGVVNFDPDALVVIGADVMDGYYAPSTAMRMLILADLAARRGVRTRILGFSFNSTPAPSLRKYFDGLHESVSVNVRDPISYGRFNSFSDAKANLVADAAFMLRPDVSTNAVISVLNWVQERRGRGDLVLAVNIHPMLLRNPSSEEVRRLNLRLCEALVKVMDKFSVSLVLLSHDYRDDVGDDVCLVEVNRELSHDYGDRVLYPMSRMSAAELKGIAGGMDGVITARMHLAIASLGMGVPVAALTYQDKFQGLFKHFGLPDKFLISPEDIVSENLLSNMLLDFVGSMEDVRSAVRLALPNVKRLSLKNIDGLIAV